MKPFKASDTNQPFLLPPSIQEWLPKEHLARFIVEIVEQLDVSKIQSQYNGTGKDAYDPQVILSLLFYGYATGVFSSRKRQRATYDLIAFRYISANTHPDHDTIANFRKRFLSELTNLFVQILCVAQEMGVLKVGKVSLDGTKVKANASKHKALKFVHCTKLQKQLEDEVQILLKKAKTADNEEDCDGMNIPKEIARREERLEVIKAAKLKIEQRAKERHKQEFQEYKDKMKHRLQTKEGKEIYSQRKSIVEPVFGVIKHVMGFRQFMLRGFKKSKGEWNLMCIAYNLKRLHTITA